MIPGDSRQQNAEHLGHFDFARIEPFDSVTIGGVTNSPVYLFRKTERFVGRFRIAVGRARQREQRRRGERSRQEQRQWHGSHSTNKDRSCLINTEAA